MSTAAQQEAIPTGRYHIRRPSLPEAALECWLRHSLSQQFDDARDTAPSRELSRLLERLGFAELANR